MFVQFRDDVVGVTQFHVVLVWVLEIAEDYALVELEFPLHGDVLLHDIVTDFTEFLSVLLINEAISEDSECLTHVEFDEIVLIFDML